MVFINDFAAGYDDRAHAYKPEWIKAVLTEAPAREILVLAEGRLSHSVRVPQVSTDDGRNTCPDITVSVPLSGVTALRYTVIGPHPLTGRIGELQTKTKPHKQFVFRRSPGVNCRPKTLPIAVSRDEVQFATSLPTATKTSSPPAYTIRVEVLDARGRVLATKSSKSVPSPRHVPLVVSLGESLAAGQGNPDEPGTTSPQAGFSDGRQMCRDFTTLGLKQGWKPDMLKQPKWLEKEAYRSLRSAPARAATQMLNDWPYLVFLSFAKSGAKLTSGANDQQHDLLEQLAEVRAVIGDRPIDVLHVSIGGNDVGFATTLRNLTVHNEGLFTGEPVALREARINRRIDSLDAILYPKVNPAIAKNRLRVNAVLINEYPGSLFNNARNQPAPGCGVFRASESPAFPWLKISRAEAAMIDRVGIRLNKAVANAARREGWHLVDGIDEAFRGHGYCSGRSWIVFAEDSCLDQGDFEGMMHPNAQGTDTIARLIAREMRKLLPKPTSGQPTVIR